MLFNSFIFLADIPIDICNVLGNTSRIPKNEKWTSAVCELSTLHELESSFHDSTLWSNSSYVYRGTRLKSGNG